MSQPSVELTLEVNIFEHLELLTEANLGALTYLRLKSRSERINLLFVAYQEGIIPASSAQELAQTLGINTQQAPWTHELDSTPHSQHLATMPTHLPQPSSERMTPLPKPARRFSERASLTEALHNATTQPLQANDPPQQVRTPKRSFADQDLKTEIEINLPTMMEDMQRAQRHETSSSGLMTQPSFTSTTPITMSLEKVRWSSLKLLSSRSHLGSKIHRYEVEDLLLNRSLHLVTPLLLTSPQDLTAIDRIPQQNLDGLILLDRYQRAYSRGLIQGSPILEVYQHSINSSLAFTTLAPQGESLMSALRHLSDSERNLLVNEAIRQLCLEIYQAHQQGVAHRAIKPSSIFIHRHRLSLEEWEWCHIIPSERFSEGPNQESSERSIYASGSFDSSQQHRVDDPLLTNSTHSQDSLWLSPEIRRGERLNDEEWFSVDLYSIGLIAVYLFTEELPSINVLESPLALEEWLFTYLSNRASSVYINGCRRALSSQPRQRPRTAQELYSSLFDEMLIS